MAVCVICGRQFSLGEARRKFDNVYRQYCGMSYRQMFTEHICADCAPDAMEYAVEDKPWEKNDSPREGKK